MNTRTTQLRLCTEYVILCLLILTTSCQPEGIAIPDNVQRISWSEQNWESGGGALTLTLWSNGQSEFSIFIGNDYGYLTNILSTDIRWQKVQHNGQLFGLCRSNIFESTQVLDVFTNALASGIHLIEPHKPDYLDGGGCGVEVVAGNITNSVTTAYFGPKQDKDNYRYFSKVNQLMNPLIQQVLKDMTEGK